MSSPSEPTRFSPPLCHTGGLFETNGWLIEGPAGWLAVDAPAEFAEFIRSRGITVSALLLTHAHFDHIEEAGEIAAEHGCPVIAWQESTAELRLEALLELWLGRALIAEPYTVTRELAGTETGEFSLCGLTVRWAHVPGHSPDSVIFYLPALDTVLAGDTLMAGSCGRTDFPGGNMDQLLRGMQRHLMRLPDTCRVLAGHGPVTTIGRERRSNPVVR